MNYKVIQKGQEDSSYIMTKQILKSIILKQL